MRDALREFVANAHGEAGGEQAAAVPAYLDA